MCSRRSKGGKGTGGTGRAVAGVDQSVRSSAGKKGGASAALVQAQALATAGVLAGDGTAGAQVDMPACLPIC